MFASANIKERIKSGFGTIMSLTVYRHRRDCCVHIFPTTFLEISPSDDFDTASSRCRRVRNDGSNMMTQFGRNLFGQ